MATSGDYYINMVTGTIQQQHNPILGKLLIAAGYTGPYDTIAEAKAFFNVAQQGVRSPGTTPGSPGTITIPHSPLSAIGDFFQKLGQANTWVRVGETLAGGILLYVGAKAFFPQTVNTVTSYAKKAGKAAIL